jgi:MFS superfamily sulfate permease-like transporter
MRSAALTPIQPVGIGLGAGSGDLRGGITSAVLTLVSTVSYAALAAAPLGPAGAASAVVSGLIGAVIGGVVACVIARRDALIFSPRASVAVVIASAATLFGQEAADPPAMAVFAVGWTTTCLVLAAVIQWVFGAMRLGGLIRLIPHPVTSGFTVGIALEMAALQMPHLAGGGAAATGVLVCISLTTTVVVTIGWARRGGFGGWAVPLGLMMGMLAHQVLRQSVGVQALPALPAIDFGVAPLYSLTAVAALLSVGDAVHALPNVLALSLVIALVNSIETLTCALAVEDLTQRRIDANRALIAGALGSLASVCGGGLPVGGGAATSVANIHAGAATFRSGLMAVALMVTLVIVFGRWLHHVPMAVVAGLMLFTAFTLARESMADLLTPWSSGSIQVQPRFDEIAVALLVCVLLLTSGILVAVVAGVVAATLLIVLRMRRTVVLRRYDANAAVLPPQSKTEIDSMQGRDIRVFEVNQPLFFATTEPLIQEIERIEPSVRFAIIDLTHGSAIDATAMRMLARCCVTMVARGHVVMMVVGIQGRTEHMASMPCEVFVELDEALRCAARQQMARSSRNQQIHMATENLSLHAAAVSGVHFPRSPSMAEPTPSPDLRPAVAPEALDAAVIANATRELTLFVGPMAKVIAQRVAVRCTSTAEFHRLLALELTSDGERTAFLRRCPAARGSPRAVATSAPASAEGLSLLRSSPTPLRSVDPIAPEVIGQASRDLSDYLGPLSKLLVARACAKALDREHLYRLLARHLPEPEQREAFLRNAKIPLRPFDTFAR